MGVLAKMFGLQKQQVHPYVEAGMQLLRSIPDAIGLGEWQSGPPCYTSAEASAIERNLSGFQHTADEMMDDKALFHPEAIEEFQRRFTAEALEELAGDDWKFSDKTSLPEDWRKRISTYLKAWLTGLSPTVLLDMAEILAKAGYVEEARRVYRVVLLFPSFAPKVFGSSDTAAKLTSSVVEDAQMALRNL